MPIVRILVILFALVSPALAQDGARQAAAAQEAAQAFRLYVEGVKQKGARPDPARPEVAALLNRIFDVGALNALPPAKGSDIEWLLEWMLAAKETSKLLMFFGAKQSQPDLTAVQRNFIEYQDQYAVMTSFMIRHQARQAVTSDLFMAGLAPKERTPVREKGFALARHSSAEMIVGAIGAVILGGSTPQNARLVAAAICDTREVWASYFLPQDRAQMIELLAGLPKRVPDETTRTDLAAFTSALRAVN